MNGEFDARKFMDDLDSGRLDGRLSESICSLTVEQLEQVAVLMANRLREREEHRNGLRSLT